MAEAEALARKCREELPGVMTVVIEQSSGLRVFGAPYLTYRVGEFAYRVSPGAFFQSARFLLPEFVAAVVAPGFSPARVFGRGALRVPMHSIGSRRPPPAGGVTSAGEEAGKVAMDIYAGVGLFTLPLAQHFEHVIAVESNGRAAADLAANARATASKKIRVVAEAAFDFLRRCVQVELPCGPKYPSSAAPRHLFGGRRSDLVVMDPPRAGVGVATLKLLLALRPKRLHYVSCSPPTLARDLGFLFQHGYTLDALEIFDFFPQTYHIESLARLSRTAR
jgi:23S rRNA (uracil1939-C5)-methyltransferase